MTWTSVSLGLIVCIIPVCTIAIILIIACIIAYFNPYCHFTWRWGNCFEIDGVGRRVIRSYRPNEQRLANVRTIQVQPRRQAPRPAAQAAIPGSPQTVEVHVVLENVEIQIEPQENNDTKKETAVLLTGKENEGETSGL